MTPYRSASGKKSGVTAYEIKEKSISVKFGGITYLYTYSSAGSVAIDKMKKYAKANKGLSTYIAQNDPPYESKTSEV